MSIRRMLHDPYRRLLLDKPIRLSLVITSSVLRMRAESYAFCDHYINPSLAGVG